MFLFNFSMISYDIKTDTLKQLQTYTMYNKE